MDGWSAGLKNCGYWSKIGWLISGDPTHINSSPCGQQHLTTSNYQSNLNVKKNPLHIWMDLKFRMHVWGYLRMVFNQLFFFPKQCYPVGVPWDGPASICTIMFSGSKVPGPSWQRLSQNMLLMCSAIRLFLLHAPWRRFKTTYVQFLSHEVTPSHHPFYVRIFHYFHHPAIKGYPH